MRELTSIRLKTAAWLVFIIGPVMGYVPWHLRRLEGSFRWDGTFWQWLGVWLVLNGVGLAGWCVDLFHTQGRGTPLPVAPPKQFVAAGPYRFVRNPMVLGLLLLLGGEALIGSSRLMFCYWLLVAAALHAFIVLVEEPGLQRRFGEGYLRYKRQVPRWIPRPISGAPKPRSR